MMGGKKIMGLPVTVWLGVAAAGLLLGLWLRRRGSSSTDAGSQTSYPLSVPAPISQAPGSLDNAVAGGGLSPATSTGVDPTVFNDLIGTETSMIGKLGDMADAIGALAFNVGSSGGSGASGEGKVPDAAPFASSAPLQPAPAPDNPDSPVKAPPPPPTPAKAKLPQVKKPAPRPPAKVTSTPTHYFTYKKNVKLGRNQTVHFTKGKGYYAA